MVKGWQKMKGVRVGRLWRVRESDIEAFLKEGAKE
jgi:excisionase family DNA binding protein